MKLQENNTTAAVIVTYNRTELLKECVTALVNQTCPLTRVIIINNGASGIIECWLKDEMRSFVNKILVIDQVNSGGAGGFHRGIKEAFELGFEWIWLMDDDAIPELTCMEKIFSEIDERSYSTIAFAPEVIEHGKVAKYHRGELVFKPDLSYIQKDSSNSEYVQFASFVGLMLHRAVVKGVGLPQEKFFILHDDVEYCLRMVGLGKIKLVKEAFIIHKTEPLQEVMISKKLFFFKFNRYKIEYLYKQYFDKRNLIWLKKLLLQILPIKVYPIFINRSSYSSFNIVYVILAEDNKMKRIGFYYKTFRNGYFGRFENDATKILNLYWK